MEEAGGSWRKEEMVLLGKRWKGMKESQTSEDSGVEKQREDRRIECNEKYEVWCTT